MVDIGAHGRVDLRGENMMNKQFEDAPSGETKLSPNRTSLIIIITCDYLFQEPKRSGTRIPVRVWRGAKAWQFCSLRLKRGLPTTTAGSSTLAAPPPPAVFPESSETNALENCGPACRSATHSPDIKAEKVMNGAAAQEGKVVTKPILPCWG